jgi:adenylate cyclase
MKKPSYIALSVRLMATTALLLGVVVSVVVFGLARHERKMLVEQARKEARALALSISQAWMNELGDENWNQIRVNSERLFRDNRKFLYLVVSADKQKNRIVASVPAEFQEHMVIDIVPLSVTTQAIETTKDVFLAETFLLHDVFFPFGERRGVAGEKTIEVAAPIYTNIGSRSGLLRMGLSLREIDETIATTVHNALVVGVVALLLGLLGAYLLARRISMPVVRLKESAKKLADGNLSHRAEVLGRDEIGDLAQSFNEMSGALQVAFERQQKTLASFQRFVPEKFLRVIAPNGVENIYVGKGEKRTIIVLFSDIRGYTAMSEKLLPEEIFELLNEYLGRMGAAINREGGFIDKYIGDAIMALFEPDDYDAVLRAALAMRSALRELNRERSKAGLVQIDTGIGIHAGEVIMGTIGFFSKIESTVIGDTVNLASRLEGLTKQYDCSILVSESVVSQLKHPESFSLRVVDEAAKVKGKDKPVVLYELVTESVFSL